MSRFVALTLILRPEPFLIPTPTRMLNINFTNVNEYLYFSPNLKKKFNLPPFIWRTCLTDKRLVNLFFKNSVIATFLHASWLLWYRVCVQVMHISISNGLKLASFICLFLVGGGWFGGNAPNNLRTFGQWALAQMTLPP